MGFRVLGFGVLGFRVSGFRGLVLQAEARLPPASSGAPRRTRILRREPHTP